MSIFSQISSAQSPPALFEVLPKPCTDYKAASHAIYCLGRLMLNRHAPPDATALSGQLLTPLQQSATQLDAREVSKADAAELYSRAM